MLDVLMLYAIKLGPIETGEGPTTAYAGFTEAGALPSLRAATRTAYRSLLGKRKVTSCAASARSCARGRRWASLPAPLPDRVRGGRATLAFALAGPGPSRVAISTSSKTSWRAYRPSARRHLGASGATTIHSA